MINLSEFLSELKAHRKHIDGLLSVFLELREYEALCNEVARNRDNPEKYGEFVRNNDEVSL